MYQARFWESVEDQKVRCFLCAHECKIDPGKRGLCHVRENQDGILYSLNYAKVVAEHIDPIEKKPLFHFLPGMIVCVLERFRDYGHQRLTK